MYTFEDLRKIIKELRSDHGCSWDRVQTHESLCPCMIEEAYEAVEAIREQTETGNGDSLKEELGDVLLQVLFHCQIGEEEGSLCWEEVVDLVAGKMVHRHPHVFPDEAGRIIPEDQVDWDALKREEKSDETPEEEIRHIPRSFPALIRSAKTLKKLEKYYGVGQDGEQSYGHAVQALEVLRMESDPAKAEEAAGEVLLAVVNMARKKGINSERALTESLEKMIQRCQK